MYTKVAWGYFDKQDTGPEPYTLADGTKVQAPMMRGVLDVRVADTAEYVAVPVQTNGELTFWVIVPKGAQTPESVVALLRDRGVGSLSDHAKYSTVDLHMPRFRIEYTSENLPDDLAAMGMPDAFSADAADFSGMADLKKLGVPLYIGDVLQKAMIDVKEAGIEAAAASAVIMAMGAAQPVVPEYTVRADRPFLVVLTGSITDAPLFMALVRDPR